MSDLRLRVLSCLAKTESVYGQDSTPSAAVNAILFAGQPTLTPMQLTSVQRDTIRPYFGNAENLPTSIYGRLEFAVEKAGSGTPGVAPAWGALLRMCGFSETILATDLTGTGQAGGGAGGIKLAAGASAVTDFYQGMPIEITAGTGVGNKGLIVDYDGTSKIAKIAAAAWAVTDATSQYKIGAASVYRRITDNPESGTLIFNIDGVQHKFLGARGSVSGEAKMDAIGRLNFSFQGLFVPVTDAVQPTVILTNWMQPQVINYRNTPLALVHGYAAGLESLTFDMANQIDFHSLINVQERMIMSDSKPSGAISISAGKVADKDWWTIAQNATLGPIVLQHGTVPGNKFAIVMPAAQIAEPKYGSKNGVAMFDANIIPTPVSGNDELCISAF
jgi:hypothetical protein